jgi:hypothetical protein
MQIRRTQMIALAAALGLLGCAGSRELARRSEVALERGDVRKAYDTARASLDKDPNNARARASLTRAAGMLVDDWKVRLRRMAESDTLASAEASLGLDPLRAELTRYRVTLALDPEFDADLSRIRVAAAGRYYREAELSLTAHHPKQAYLQFETVRTYDRNFRDVVERMGATWELAVTRVAVLPPDNQTGVPGLARSLADAWAAQVAKKLDSDEFRFTRLVPMERVYDRMTVAQLDRIEHEDAVRLGRTLGAQRVVWGRAFGLRSDSHTDRYHETVFRKTTAKNDDGTTRVVWVEDRFEAVTRERQVDAQVELEVLDTDAGEVLARHEEPVHAEALTCFSNFRPAGPSDDYALVSPELKNSDPVAAKHVEERWKDTFGDLSVPKVIEKTRSNSSRRRYRPEYANEFSGAGRTPIYLDDLPPADDLARMALAPGWRPIVRMLADLDRK